MSLACAAVILAAGQGKRMRSSLPKVLHPCGEWPLVVHGVQAALDQACAPVVVVVSPEAQGEVQRILGLRFPKAPLRFVVQALAQGTGDAVRVGLADISEFSGHVLILYADVPLLTSATLARLKDAGATAPLAFVTAVFPTDPAGSRASDPTGYGRVLRDNQAQVVGIVEERDATPQQRAIQEINAGVYLVESTLLRQAVEDLKASNAQKEFYLTDVVAMAAQAGGAVGVCVESPDEIRGVNSQAELAVAESILRQRLIAFYQARGVYFQDPSHTFVGMDVCLEPDVTLGVGVQLYGRTWIASGAQIEGPCVIRDTRIGARSRVYAFSHLDHAVLSEDVCVGPLARLRPEAHLEARSRVGNFVEVKKTRLGPGSKANHLTYLGDAQVGADCNIGAGTITCNYDGTHKHLTQIGEGVFVGSHATLVAPLNIASGAFVAAGSTLTQDVPSQALALARTRQVNREGYATVLRQRQRASKGTTASTKQKGTLMCGIVGYVGSDQAAEYVLDGLRRLEYRGYDSAGIATLYQGQIRVCRRKGKLRFLSDALKQTPLPGTAAIGHTRWATHGRPSDENAHPHQVDDVVLVHNGIIENFLALAQALSAQGRRFESETDTEIIAHLIALAPGSCLQERVRQALAQVQGAYAIAVMSTREPDTLVVAKNASPLILGIRSDAGLIASDIPALLPHTRQVIVLEEGEIATVRPGSYQISTLSGTPVQRAPRTIDGSAVMAEKDGHKHFMHKEIYEQPRAVVDTLRGRLLSRGVNVDLENEPLVDACSKAQRVMLTACGTSWHACLVGRLALEELAQMGCEVELASELRYRHPLMGPETVTVAVSQSGETADTLAAIKAARRLGSQVMAVVNVVDSSIAREADGTFYTHAGPEIGVASTKAFTTQVLALILLAIGVGRKRGLDEARAGALLEGLRQIPLHIESALQQEPQVIHMAHRLVGASSVLFLGRGYGYPVALEGALKLKETSYIHAEGYAAGEMKHGPIALIEPGLPVVVVATQGPLYEKIVSNIQEVRARDAYVIAVATAGDEQIAKVANAVVYVPEVDPLLAPLLTTVPLQLLAYHVADLRGTDVDQPRNLAKSVTVE